MTPTSDPNELATLDEANRARLVEELDTSFFVEASAGTGKTHELVRRLVALLAAGAAEVEGLAVITFTEKAAGELQLRVREALDAARANASPETRARIERAIAHLEEATIDTIHGFCREILRTRPVEARIDPDFVVDGDGARLLARVFSRWLAEKLSDPPPGIARFLARNRIFRPDETAISVLQEAAKRLLGARELAAPWPRPELDVAGEAEALAGEVGAVAELVRAGDRDDVLRIELALLLDFAEWNAESGPGDAPEREARIADVLRHLNGVFGKKGRADIWRGPFAEGVGRLDIKRRASMLHRDLKRWNQLAEQDLAAALQAELREVVERQLELSRRSGRIDFHGLLVSARDLVRDRPDVRRALQRRFTHLFVDEFQDTDRLQAEIVLLLAADDPEATDFLSARPRPGRLTLVGDPKQSIYAFRRADPSLYAAVERALVERGVEKLTLGRSHRALAPIQDLVNEAFAAHFDPDPRDPASLHQPSYVPLTGGPPPLEGQPAVVALPVPMPFDRFPGKTYAPQVKKQAPDVVGDFVAWLVRESGWRVRGEGGALRPVEPSDVCLLFKQTTSWGELLITPFQRRLEAHGIDTVFVGARLLNDRDEVENLITALSALEHPDDELMVYGTLTGPLFAFTDADLWLFRQRRGSLHPFRRQAPDALEGIEREIATALELLRELTRRRNRRPFADTVQALLQACRAHVAFGLRPAGAQALANVERVIELARVYEAEEGLSFRGYVERLREEADQVKGQEGALNEETAPGVRLMTVHKAKGLEFPVVVLADVASTPHTRAVRHEDPEAGLAAFELAGLVPKPVADHRELAEAKAGAENLRVGYVAATRARDLFVVPTAGADPGGLISKSWIHPVLRAIHPPRSRDQQPEPCPGAPAFGERSVAFGEGRPVPCVKPGLHLGAAGGAPVAWWDPTVLARPPDARFGLAHEAYLAPGPLAEAGRAEHAEWLEARATTLGDGGYPSVVLRDPSVASGAPHPIAEQHLEGAQTRPGGRRFGLLVHQAARDLGFEATRDDVGPVVELHARSLGAETDERAAARAALEALLESELFARARAALHAYRDFAVVHASADGDVTDTRLDLLFAEGEAEALQWIAVDLVTGAPDADALRAKMGHALTALEASGRRVGAGVILHL